LTAQRRVVIAQRVTVDGGAFGEERVRERGWSR
jgi:hypothetical protein